MTDTELDEILTVRWPSVVRQVMADGSDDWLKGFVRSIARHGKRPTWRPSPRQERIMLRLLADQQASQANIEPRLIERD